MRRFIYMLIAMLVLVACDKEQPFRCTLIDMSAEHITSNSAELSATVNASDYSAIERMGFKIRRRGGEVYDYMPVAISREISVVVGSLRANTTYEYCVYIMADGDTWNLEHRSFRTNAVEPNPDDNGGQPTTTVYRVAWYELPAEVDDNGDGIDDNNDAYYYAHHLCAGGERNAQRSTAARNYSVCFSSEHHCPMWVAAPRHDMYEGSTNRTNAYAHDPQIPVNIQYVRKDADSGCNNGHMLGSAERTSSTATNKQVFYFSNIAPQYSDTFNTGGGAWNNLEGQVDKLVCSDTLYEVIGCYFDEYTDAYGRTSHPKKISFGGRNDVSCPTMYYYALLRTKSGNSGKSVAECSAEELQCAAFVLSHEQSKGHKPQVQDMITIDELERITGFDYFVNVPNAPEGVLNTSDWL